MTSSKADSYKLDQFRLLLMHEVITEVVEAIWRQIYRADVDIDHANFPDALERASQVLELPLEELEERLRSHSRAINSDRYSGGNLAGWIEPPDLLNIADTIRLVAGDLRDANPECLHHFTMGLTLSWMAGQEILQGALRTSLEHYPWVSPVLSKEDSRQAAAARSHQNQARERKEGIPATVKAVLTAEAQKRKRSGTYDPNSPPLVRDVARMVSREMSGPKLAASTLEKSLHAKDIKEIWVRQAG